MQFLRACLAVLFAASCLHAFAHPGGHGNEDPIDQKQAASAGEQVVQALLREKRLTASWSQRQLQDAKLEQTPYGPVWVVSYRNPAEKDARKQMVYVLLDDAGNYLGAGHTLTLPGK